MQKVTHEDTLTHGIIQTAIENVPGGEWTIIGLASLGAGTLGWWHIHKYVEQWIGHVMDKRRSGSNAK